MLFEMYQGTVQILMMLKVLFTQDSEVEDLFVMLLPALNQSVLQQ